MKKWFAVFILIFVFVLSACSSDQDNLAGKTFNIAYSPSPVEVDVDNPSKYQSFMKVEFLRNNKISHKVYDETEGTYQLNDNELILIFENKNEKLTISFVDFKESEKDFSTYAAVVGDAKSDIKDASKIEHLNLISNKVNLNMSVEFIELTE